MVRFEIAEVVTRSISVCRIWSTVSERRGEERGEETASEPLHTPETRPSEHLLVQAPVD